MRHPALTARFIVGTAAILAVTGVAKVWAAFAPTKVLAVADPITGLSFVHLMLAVGVLELVTASICLFAKSPTLKLGLIAWLATSFVIYRLGLWWMGWKSRTILVAEVLGEFGTGSHRADRDGLTPGQLDPERHDRRANYLCFDGHVKAYAPAEVVGVKEWWGTDQGNHTNTLAGVW